MEKYGFEQDCKAMILTEQAIQRQYKSMKIGLPKISRTPELRSNKELRPFPVKRHKLYRLLKGEESTGRTLSRPKVAMSKQVLSLLQIDAKIDDPSKRKSFKISDPRFTSQFSTLKTKANRKPQELSFLSSLFTLSDSSRSQSCERWEPKMSPMFSALEDKVKRCLKPEKPYGETPSHKVHTYAHFFPPNGRKHPHRLLAFQKAFEFLPPPAFCSRVHSLKSVSCERLKANLKDSQKDIVGKPMLKLADDDDEYKCVLEGEWVNPVIHV